MQYMNTQVGRRSTQHSHRGTASRGFALALVIMLALAAALAIGLMLDRHGSSIIARRSQWANYRDLHTNAGIQEMVDRWLATTRGSIQDRLEDDNLAFQMMLPTGQRIRVYLEDAQGATLNDFRSLHGLEALYSRRVAAALVEDGIPQAPEDEPLYFREAGPAKISVNSAPEEVIRGVAKAIAPDGSWSTFARDLLARRQQGNLAQVTIREIGQAAGLTPEEVAAAELMLVAEATCYRVLSETTTGGVVTSRTTGLMEINSRGNGGGAGAGGLGSTRFLTWNTVRLAP